MERIRRRWWTGAVTGVALVLVTGALLTAGFQLVMLLAPGYRDDLADYVSRAVGQPVDIGGVGLGWYGLAPRLDLNDITLYGEDERTPALSAERLRLGFGAARLLRGDVTPDRVELSGVELFARIDGEGRFSLRGLDTSGMPARATQDWLRQLGRFQSVRLSRCELQLDDARLRGPQPRFRLVDAELRFAHGRGSATARLALPPSIGASVRLDAQIAGDLERPETWDGRWSASVEGLSGLPWLDALLAPGATLRFAGTSLRMDGVLERGHPGAMTARLEADTMVGRHRTAQTALRNIRLAARVMPQAQGWMLDVTRLELNGTQGAWPLTQARLRLSREAADAAPGEADARAPLSVDAEASYLRLSDLVPWLALLPGERASADAARLQGVGGGVRRLVLRWDAPGPGAARPRYSLRADLDGLSLAPRADRPGFDGLSGELSASENGGRLHLRESTMSLRHDGVFAQPLPFERIVGELSWTRTGEGWDVSMPQFGWSLDGSRGEGAMQLFVPADSAQGGARVKLDARFSSADVTRLKRYMPRFWPDRLRQWLDRAVRAGRAPSARLRIDGALADFPFVDAPGTFALDIDAADAVLAFAPDWPPLERLAAHLEFRGNSLAIRGDSGSVMGNRVEHVTAFIADLHEPQLGVQAEVQGDAARFYDFLRASPLAARLAGLLTRTTASGDAVVRVDLDIPLRDPHQTQAHGEVQLRGVQLHIAGVPEPVSELRGTLLFDNREVTADALSAQMFGTALSATLRRDDDGVLRVRSGFGFVADGTGGGPGRLLPRFLRENLDGRSDWKAEVALDGAQAGHLRLDSSLSGLRIDLPEPMHKPADATWPVSVHIAAERIFPLRVTVELPERAGVDLAFAQDAGNALFLQRGRVRLGAGPSPYADEDGFLVSGSVAELDPLAWMAAMAPPRAAPIDGMPAAAPFPAVAAELEVGTLHLGAHRIQSLRLSHAPAPGGWRTRVTGEGADGVLELREGGDAGSLTGRFGRLRLAAQRERPADRRDPAPDAAREPADPTRLPRLDFDVAELAIGEAALGRLELRTQRIPQGQRIELLRTHGAGGQVDVRGQWRREGGRSSGDLQFSVQTEAVGPLLAGLGYAPSLSARRARLRGLLDWPAAAADAERGLRLATAEGYLELDFEKGVLRSVEPGAGRVLGLINFWALPRRMALDFRDVLSQGLAFDRIAGRFDMTGGNAYTRNLDVDGPSLDMQVRGRVGLAARDYDQRVKVYPDVSAGVTLGALLLGGPAAGVLALIAQEVLDQPLDQVGQLSYRLTGSWDDPQVVREPSGLLPGGDAPDDAPVPHAETAP